MHYPKSRIVSFKTHDHESSIRDRYGVFLWRVYQIFLNFWWVCIVQSLYILYINTICCDKLDYKYVNGKIVQTNFFLYECYSYFGRQPKYSTEKLLTSQRKDNFGFRCMPFHGNYVRRISMYMNGMLYIKFLSFVNYEEFHGLVEFYLKVE